MKAVCENRVTLIAGETGCGKTTQVPQFLLDHEVKAGRGGDCNIICTQPRRIAAIGVADRVAVEQGCQLGGTVGYQIRLDAKMSRDTRLLFCTTGILLRRMHGDPDLQGVTHVIVDEVHERNVDTDFLLAVLRTLVHRRSSAVKVVLMSATMESNLIARYFERSPGGEDGGELNILASPPPVISIPGFVYPVEEFYLEDILEATGYIPLGTKKGWREIDTGAGLEDADEDSTNDSHQGSVHDDGTKRVKPFYLAGSGRSDKQASCSASTLESLQRLAHGSARRRQMTDYGLVAATVALADEEGRRVGDEGAVLVFMSGTMEISKACSAIMQRLEGRPLLILPLHGALTSADQARVFRRAPRGVRKVVVATNIAETSITIDDCSFVIDSARVKETHYDPDNRMSCLVEAWVSRASARQRRGRAGRVRNGRCYRLFTRSALARLPAHQTPEIHRVPLYNLCLQIRLLGLGKPRAFLSTVIEPPPREAIRAAVFHLRALGAFQQAPSSDLTPLGYHLARMPVDPKVGKMLIFGSLLRCTEDVLTIAACLCSRTPFLSPADKRDEASRAKAKLAGPTRSDHIALLRAYHGWQDAGKGRRRFCEENFLSYDGMRTVSDLRRQLGTLLVDAGFASSSKRNGGRSTESSFATLKSTNILRAALCAGMFPNIIKVKKPPKAYYEMSGGNFEKTPEPRELKFFCKIEGNAKPAMESDGMLSGGQNQAQQRSQERVFLHPSSVNFKEGGFASPWMVYFQKVKTSRVFIRDSTMVPPYAMALFGGSLEVVYTRNKIVVDGWAYFDAPARVGVLVQELRKELSTLLNRKIENPGIDISESPLIDAITRLLTKAGY